MTERKDSNPKQAYGDKKVGVSTVPMAFLYGVAMAMAEGGMKYGRHNYRALGCKHSTYFDAAVGHLVSWWEGEDIDEESGVHHLLKAAASIAVMYDSIVMKNDNDDRPIRYPAGTPLRVNEAMVKLQEKHPNPKPPFTEKEHGKRKRFIDRIQEAIGYWNSFGPNVDTGLANYKKMNELFGLKQVKALGPVQKGEPVYYNPEAAENLKKMDDAVRAAPTESEIDRVLDHIFKQGDEPDFLIVERKGRAKMTPEIHRLIEQAINMGIEPLVIGEDSTPYYDGGIPGYGGNVDAKDGYRPICDECPSQEICREDLTCGDCAHFIPAGRTCLKGKLLLHSPTEDTPALGCHYFERKTNENEQD